MGPDCQTLPCLRRCSWWVPAVRGANCYIFARTHFLACEDVAGGSQQSGGNVFFREIRWPVRWVPAVRWRNNYFAHNREALPCCGRGPSGQPLHVQSTSDGSRSLTTLTTLRREHQGGGRWRGLGRGRRRAGKMRQWMPTRRGVRGFTGSLWCEAAVAVE
mgnify:CR=1 FL=1